MQSTIKVSEKRAITQIYIRRKASLESNLISTKNFNFFPIFGDSLKLFERLDFIFDRDERPKIEIEERSNTVKNSEHYNSIPMVSPSTAINIPAWRKSRVSKSALLFDGAYTRGQTLPRKCVTVIRITISITFGVLHLESFVRCNTFKAIFT